MTGGVVSNSTAETLARVFKALSDPARVKLISLIAAAHEGEACICDLTAPVGLSQPTVSHHMKLLVEAGLATREQRGKWAYSRRTPLPCDRPGAEHHRLTSGAQMGGDGIRTAGDREPATGRRRIDVAASSTSCPTENQVPSLRGFESQSGDSPHPRIEWKIPSGKALTCTDECHTANTKCPLRSTRGEFVVIWQPHRVK
jgi:ArsR family transcriptional regulator